MVAGTAQVYVVVTELKVGPVAGVHDAMEPLGPVKVHVGVPVGARDPTVPVTVAV